MIKRILVLFLGVVTFGVMADPWSATISYTTNNGHINRPADFWSKQPGDTTFSNAVLEVVGEISGTANTVVYNPADKHVTTPVDFWSSATSDSSFISAVNTIVSLDGDGSGIVNLNASALASGTVADERLSPNVAVGTNAPVANGLLLIDDNGNKYWATVVPLGMLPSGVVTTSDGVATLSGISAAVANAGVIGSPNKFAGASFNDTVNASIFRASTRLQGNTWYGYSAGNALTIGSTTTPLLSVTATNVGLYGTLTTTNGLLLPQLTAIPTNAISSAGAVATASQTNWLMLNLTNTINGGGIQYWATNTVNGGYLWQRPAVTSGTY